VTSQCFHLVTFYSSLVTKIGASYLGVLEQPASRVFFRNLLKLRVQGAREKGSGMKYREPRILILGSPEQMALKGANLFADRARACVNTRGNFFVVLSGGSTPRRMHRLLIQESYRSEIPWGQMHVFWVDERCVPSSDPASNFGAAETDFIRQAPIPEGQVHPMPAEMAPELGALKYQEDLVSSFQLRMGEFPVFDVIFLGVGADGHTASLFPRQKALHETERMVVAVKGGEPDVSRLTMTLPVINNAREIVFLVCGKEKAGVVKSIIERGDQRLPAHKIAPDNGVLTWLLDRDAASLLTRDSEIEQD
jgi:6-phosphogluconolactonase